MRKPVQPLAIRTRPEGVGTLRVESLSGYCQRLAAENCLPVSSLFALLVGCEGVSVRDLQGIRRLTHPDVHCEPLRPLASLVGRPSGMVEALSCLPVFRTLYPGATIREHSMRMCFLPPYGLHTFSTTRRFCPLCLRERPLFPLLWQFSEIRVCLQHDCWLREQCPWCRKPSPLLKGNSMMGRCYYCTRSLSRATSSAITRRDRVHQEVLHQDYAWLLTHQGSLLTGSPATAQVSWWARRLSYLRHQEGLGIKVLANRLKVSPSTVC